MIPIQRTLPGYAQPVPEEGLSLGYHIIPEAFPLYLHIVVPSIELSMKWSVASNAPNGQVGFWLFNLNTAPATVDGTGQLDINLVLQVGTYCYLFHYSG